MMARALPLYEMMPDAPLDGMVLVHEALRDSEVTQCIKDMTMEVNLEFMFLILGYPTMRLDVGFIELVSSLLFSPPNRPSNPII